jgi:hypothetical protein
MARKMGAALETSCGGCGVIPDVCTLPTTGDVGVLGAHLEKKSPAGEGGPRLTADTVGACQVRVIRTEERASVRPLGNAESR